MCKYNVFYRYNNHVWFTFPFATDAWQKGQLLCHDYLIELSHTLQATTFDTVYWGIWEYRIRLSFQQLKRTFQTTQEQAANHSQIRARFETPGQTFPQLLPPSNIYCRARCSGKVGKTKHDSLASMQVHNGP